MGYHLFKPDDAYRKVKLGVRQLSNVFVSHYGLVINNGLLVKGYAPNIGHTTYDDDGVYLKHWRKGLEEMLVSRFGKSLKSIRLDDDRTYLVIHSPWFSYYFWLTECLPRLLSVKEFLSEVVLIYPNNWDKNPFVKETLCLFPELQIHRIPNGHHMIVKNLIMPEVKPWTPMFIPEQIRQTAAFLNPIPEQTPPTANIYLSRRKNKRRKMSDEGRVESILKDYNFKIVDPDDLSLNDQVSLMWLMRNPSERP